MRRRTPRRASRSVRSPCRDRASRRAPARAARRATFAGVPAMARNADRIAAARAADAVRRAPASRRSARRSPRPCVRRRRRARSRRTAPRRRARTLARSAPAGGEGGGASSCRWPWRSAPSAACVSPKARASRRRHGALRSSASSTAANSAESPIRTDGLLDAEEIGGRERQLQHVGIGGDAVGAPEQLDAGLQELAGLVAADAEHRAEIGVVRLPLRRAGGEVVQADGNRVVGAERQLGAVGARWSGRAGGADPRRQAPRTRSPGARSAARRKRSRRRREGASEAIGVMESRLRRRHWPGGPGHPRARPPASVVPQARP